MPRFFSLFAFVVAIVLVFLTSWIRIAISLSSARPAPLPENYPDLIAYDAKISMMAENDKPATEVIVPVIKHYQNQSMQLINPTIVYLTSNDPLKITAPLGTISENNELVQLSHGVVISLQRASDLITLMTPAIEINIKTNLLQSTESVTVRQGENVIRGTGFVYNDQSKVFELIGPVQGFYYPYTRS